MNLVAEKCLTMSEMREALIRIVQSSTDSAVHLRHLAAKALHCGTQPTTLAEALQCVAVVGASEGAMKTTSILLKNNTKFVLPRIYVHTDGKIALEWQCSPDTEVLLVVDATKYEYFKIVQDRLSVHREYVSYFGSIIEEPISRNLPLA
jgi:hypothetical protein